MDFSPKEILGTSCREWYKKKTAEGASRNLINIDIVSFPAERNSRDFLLGYILGTSCRGKYYKMTDDGWEVLSAYIVWTASCRDR